MARPGRRVVAKVLPQILIAEDIDFVIAQGENVTHGKGMAKKHYYELEEVGIDAFSGGNHSLEREESRELIKDPKIPITAPANSSPDYYPKYKIVQKGDKKIAIVSILGYTFPNGYVNGINNPLTEIDLTLKELKAQKINNIIVNFHGDLSSEKVVFGYYLDGKVSAVLGDHWHVPTADARVLPQGTAHVSDVGMCGSLHSSLGVTLDVAINRWQTGDKMKNELEGTKKGLQFNAMLVAINDTTGLATSIKRIQRFVD